MDASCDSTSSLAPHSNNAQNSQDDITTVTTFALDLLSEELRLNRHLSHPLDLATIEDWPSSMTPAAKLSVTRGRALFEAGLTIAVREYFEDFADLSEDVLQVLETHKHAMRFPKINVLLMRMMSEPKPRAPFDIEETFFCLLVNNWIQENLQEFAQEVYCKATEVLVARLPQ
ncbi:hypothetical protein C8R46DRAFT_1058749 [Mycena filopes]|nr:hypothetical protein C8R46DRAFT_1058749 [Mycena filopes]